MKTSRPGADVSTLNARTNGSALSMDSNSSHKRHDDPNRRPGNTNSQERIAQKRSMKKDVETDTETQNQTKKILEEFLKKSLQKKENWSNYERPSKVESKKLHAGQHVKPSKYG